MNKSETVFSIEKSEKAPTIAVVKAKYSRNEDFEDYAFTIEDGLPVETNVSDTTREKVKKGFSPESIDEVKLLEVVDGVFLKNERYKYSELWQTIKMVFEKKVYFISDNSAKLLLTYLKNEHYIKKGEDGYYVQT